MVTQNKNSKLRVFITIPELQIGGAQKMVEQLVTNIDYNKYEVLFVIQSALQGTYLEKTVSQSGATVIYFNKKLGFHLYPFFQAWKALNKFHPHIIHTHLQSWNYLIPWVIFHKVKVLHTIHSRAKRQENNLRRFIIKRFYKKSKFIPVAISDEIAKEAVGVYDLPPNRIETVFNPVSFSQFSNIERIPHSTFNFVMVARFGKVKNHLFLIEVFSKVCSQYRNARLLLAGDGEMLEPVKKRVAELAINENVEFLGIVEDIPRLLARCDAFVLPSLHEGLPMTLLEAEAAGLPVIVSAVGGMPDIVNGNGYLVDVNDSLNFEKHMIKLITDPALCAAQGTVSKTIASQYDVVQITNQYEGLYEKYASRN